MTKNQLRQFFLSESFPENSIESFMKIIDVPEGGEGLVHILPFLPDLLQKIHSMDGYYSDFQFDPKWIGMAATLPSLMQGSSEERNESKRSPLWGYYQSHAVYAAIWSILKERPTNTAYVELLAHVVVAANIIRNKSDRNTEYRNILITAPGALRKAYQADLSLEELALDCAPRILLKSLRNSSLAENLAPVCTLLGYVRGKSAPQREACERRATFKNKMAVYKYDENGLDEEQMRGTAQITLITQRRDDLDEDEQLLAEGEISHYPDMIAASSPSRQLHTLIQSILFSQRAARTSLVRRNQALPHSWERLTVHEVIRFWIAIEWLSRHPSTNTTHPSDVLATMMAIMLFCGKSVEEAANMRIYHGDLPDQPLSGLQRQNGQWYWISIPYSADYRYGTPKGTYLILPLPQSANTVFHLALSDSDTISTFADIPALHTDIQTIISGINKKYRTRLTNERISHYLFEQIQQQEGADVSSAMYITGKSAYLGTVVSHYTRQSGYRLTSIYRKVWEGIFPSHPADRPEENLPQNRDIGSSRVPSRKTIQSLVAQLKQKISICRESYKKDNDYRNLIKYHNALTRYTAIYIAYATGIRAVTHPFPDDENIDHETGFCVISDKDSDDHYHTRLIWIPPDCHKQYLLYRNHSKIVAATMANIRNDFFHKSQDRFFFLDENGSPAAISPKRLYYFSDLLEPVVIPENGNRHMLRSWLLAHGVSPEVINAFLGHWFLGEEPWAQHSALSPHQYRMTLSTHILTLLDHLGFEPIVGIEGIAQND